MLVPVVEQITMVPTHTGISSLLEFPPPQVARIIRITNKQCLFQFRFLTSHGFYLGLWYHLPCSCYAAVFPMSSSCFKQCESAFSCMRSALFLPWFGFLDQLVSWVCVFLWSWVGSHCVYGRETAWRTRTRSRLAPWNLIGYNWKVWVLTPLLSIHSVILEDKISITY